jgi:uncharacterized membrane protein YhaH (DUF805 family)
MQWYLKVLTNYVGFTGRARRSEYWWFVLINALILLVLTVVGRAMNSTILYTLYSLAVFLPGLAVSVRRLHDTDKSGWWLLINFIPFIGWIVYLVFMFTDSTPGANQYGPSPKEATSAI